MSTQLQTVPFVVMKFGGTSVADQEAIGRLLSIVRSGHASLGTPPIVAVSATSGTTDQRLARAAAAQRGEADVDGGVDRVLQRHLAIVNALTSGERARVLAAAVEREMSQLRAVLTAIGILREASPRSF